MVATILPGQRIVDLPAITSLSNTDLMVVSQSAITKKCLVGDVINSVNNNINFFNAPLGSFTLYPNCHLIASYSSGLQLFPLPATCPVGATFQIVGNSATFFKITQGTGQVIYSQATASTVGAAGYAISSTAHGYIELVCTTQDTGFTVTNKSSDVTLA